jgi:hypothetical protein
MKSTLITVLLLFSLPVAVCGDPEEAAKPCTMTENRCAIGDSSVPAAECELVIATDLDRLPFRFSANPDATELFISRKKVPLDITSFGVMLSPKGLRHPKEVREAGIEQYVAVNGSLTLDKHPLSLAIPERIAEEKHVYCFMIVKEGNLRSVNYIISLGLVTKGPNKPSHPREPHERARALPDYTLVYTREHGISPGADVTSVNVTEIELNLGKGALQRRHWPGPVSFGNSVNLTKEQAAGFKDLISTWLATNPPGAYRGNRLGIGREDTLTIRMTLSWDGKSILVLEGPGETPPPEQWHRLIGALWDSSNRVKKDE